VEPLLVSSVNHPTRLLGKAMSHCRRWRFLQGCTELTVQTFVDHCPRAASLRVDFAFSMDRPGAWAIQQPFRAHRDRTNASGHSEVALIAGSATFSPLTGLFSHSYEVGIHPGKNRHVRICFRQELNTGPTCERNYRIGLRNTLFEKFQEFTIALSFHGGCGGCQFLLVLTCGEH